MRVYVAVNVNIPKYLHPFIEVVTFADGQAWEFVDVEKMEFDVYSNSFHIFFNLNGKTEEVHLYGMLLSDLMAVYTH